MGVRHNNPTKFEWKSTSFERSLGGLAGSVFWPFGVAVGARGTAWARTSPPHLSPPAPPPGPFHRRILNTFLLLVGRGSKRDQK